MCIYIYIYSRTREFCIHLFCIIFRRIFSVCTLRCRYQLCFDFRYDREDCRRILEDENVISIHNEGRGGGGGERRKEGRKKVKFEIHYLIKLKEMSAESNVIEGLKGSADGGERQQHEPPELRSA